MSTSSFGLKKPFHFKKIAFGCAFLIVTFSFSYKAFTQTTENRADIIPSILFTLGLLNDDSAPTNEIDFGLNPTLAPWENFDLSIWGLDSPALADINVPGAGTRIDDFEFVALNEQNSGLQSAQATFFGQGNQQDSSPYFFTGPDGGMVFKSPVDGGRTSIGSRFPRSELREYARGGDVRRVDGSNISVTGTNEKNWVLGYQPDE